jgi:hypothetical protein
VTVAPDLIVEVRSPDETQRTLDEKLRDYQTAGTHHRWIIDPDTRSVLLTTDGRPDRSLSVNDSIDDVDVLPGFSCEVARLFIGLAKPATYRSTLSPASQDPLARHRPHIAAALGLGLHRQRTSSLNSHLRRPTQHELVFDTR